MAVASIWRRAWTRLRSRGSVEDVADGRGGRLRPTGGEDDADGGSIRLRPWIRLRSWGGGDDDVDSRGGWSQSQPNGGYITSSGTAATYTASTTTAAFDSVGESQSQPHDFHASMSMDPPTAPVVEETPEEEHDVDMGLEEDIVEKLEHLKGLVVQFRGDNRSALERWLLEMDVGWVVHLAPGTHASSGSVVASHGFQFLVQSWILALHKIGESILITSLDGWCCGQDQDQDQGTSKQPSTSEFAELVHAIVLKMLPFVDIAAAKTTHSPGALAQKLQVLIDMHDAVSMASEHVLPLLSNYVQEECSDDTMRELLSADLTKLDEAIWDTVVGMRNNIMVWTCTDDGGSSDIHKVTHSIASYTKVLWANYKFVNRILEDAVLRGEFVSDNKKLNHVTTNLITQMISSLESEPSSKNSSPASFPDESLRFLFLINNFHYLLQEFHTIQRFSFAVVSFTYDINRYLHVSWEPVLKCLQDPATPSCFSRYSSPLPRFESKFHKACAAQQFWKVPDPEMRRRLRKAIVDKVIPGLTQFLEDNHIAIATPLGCTPMMVEKMLGELFEG